PRQLEGRMLAVLDAARNRAVPGARLRLACGVAAAAVLVPLASVQAARVRAGTGPVVVPVGDGSTEARPVDRQRSTPPATDRDQFTGTWEIRPSKTPGNVHVRVTIGDSSWGSDWAMSKLEGLLPPNSVSGGLVNFKVQRDAGTFTFEGMFRNGN